MTRRNIDVHNNLTAEMQNQLYRHRCLHDSLEDSSTIYSLLLKTPLVIRTADVLFGRTKKPPSREC